MTKAEEMKQMWSQLMLQFVVVTAGIGAEELAVMGQEERRLDVSGAGRRLHRPVGQGFCPQICAEGLGLLI